MKLLKVFLFVISTKIFQKPSVKGTLKYQPRYISGFTTSAFPILILLFFTFHFSLFTLYGCGYTIHGRASLPFDSIRIGKIENKTFEPKLQDKLYSALTEEFLKQGITVHPDAKYTLSGTIHRFELHILSTRDDIAIEYKVVIEGDFTLADPSGNVKQFRNIGSPFIVSLLTSGTLSDVIASKELASEKALRDMAMEIVGVIIYR